MINQEFKKLVEGIRNGLNKKKPRISEGFLLSD